MLVYGKADGQVVGLDQMRVEQLAKQRVARLADVAERAGAVENIAELACGLGLALAAQGNDHIDALLARLRVDDSAGCYLQPPFGHQFLEPLCNLRSDAVAMDVPPWPRMAQEPCLLPCRQRLPDVMAVGPQGI